jgi:two-component system, OmpR family, sensor histidine kinase BaeS
MKIGITYRLFLSILAATCVALLCMFLIMQRSINRGFLQYLNSQEQGRLEQMAVILEQAYTEHGNWDFLRNNQIFLIGRLLHATPADADSGKLHESDKMGVPPARQKDTQQPSFSLIVLDAERNPLLGNAEAQDAKFKAIVHNNETVGYVGLIPPKQFLNSRQLRFLHQQKSAFILAALGMVLIVVIFSLPLASRLVRPIRAIAAATRDLASGKYTIRVPVSSSDELGQLARDFNTMALTLEKNAKARRQWVADISHELRTPLAVLRGEIEALLDGIRATTPDAIRSLHTEALRLHRLVEDIYQLALSDRGTLTYHKEELDLAGVLRNSIAPYRAEFARKGIRISTEESEVSVFADRERLQQLFTNLLDNSLKYTDTGGELAISLACSNSRAIIEFQDSAPCVPEDELDRLFDRLYRVEESRNRSSGGAGLGLAICKNIVEAHDGTITADPSPSGGVLIRVDLPVSGGCS